MNIKLCRISYAKVLQLWLIKAEISFKNRHFLWDSLCEVCSFWNISFSLFHVCPILFSLSARLSMYTLSGVINSPVYLIFTHIIITHCLILFYFVLLFSFYYHKVFQMIYSLVIKSNWGNSATVFNVTWTLDPWELVIHTFSHGMQILDMSETISLFCDLMDEGYPNKRTYNNRKKILKSNKLMELILNKK